MLNQCPLLGVRRTHIDITGVFAIAALATPTPTPLAELVAPAAFQRRN